MKKIKTNFKDYNKLDFLKYYDKLSIGYERNGVADPNDMSIYYNEKDIKENGVVGIKIKLVND